jgi:hypothetical protein
MRNYEKMDSRFFLIKKEMKKMILKKGILSSLFLFEIFSEYPKRYYFL